MVAIAELGNFSSSEATVGYILSSPHQSPFTDVVMFYFCSHPEPSLHLPHLPCKATQQG